MTTQTVARASVTIQKPIRLRKRPPAAKLTKLEIPNEVAPWTERRYGDWQPRLATVDL